MVYGIGFTTLSHGATGGFGAMLGLPYRYIVCFGMNMNKPIWSLSEHSDQTKMTSQEYISW